MNAWRLFGLIILVGLTTFTTQAHANQPEVRSALQATTTSDLADRSVQDRRAGPRKTRVVTSDQARRQSRALAYSLFTDPDFSWDYYGVGDCLRQNRSTVLCLTYLGEFLYDLDGIYLTTSICSWWTVVYYPRSGPLRVAYRDLECIEI